MGKKKRGKYVSTGNLAAWASRLATITLLVMLMAGQIWIIANAHG